VSERELERRVESLERNIYDIAEAIGDAQITDGQRVRRLLMSLLPHDYAAQRQKRELALDYAAQRQKRELALAHGYPAVDPEFGTGLRRRLRDS
jgi:hypothetical protein